MTKYIFGIVALILLVGGGCSSVAPNANEDSTVPTNIAKIQGDVVINMQGNNYSFSPNVINVKVGDKVVINFESKEGYHDFVVDEFSANTGRVNSGGKSSVSFIANKVGEFEYYCSVGNHRAKGMIGKLIVKAKEEIIVGDPIEEVVVLEKEEAVVSKSGIYENYTPEKLALAENYNVVLFFHASWCPSCRVLDKDLTKNLSDFPDDLVILKINYDDAKELRKKYKITTQHTLVQVDKSGNQITKWIGGNDLNYVISKIK